MKNNIKTVSLIMSLVLIVTSFFSVNAASIYASINNHIVIISQPENISADVGDKISFHIEAVGSGIKYNWQHSGNGGSTWHDTPHNGHDTNTISFDVKSFSYNMLYRCIITDSNGNSITSNTCKITNDNDILKIISQPNNFLADIGDSVSFSVNATGTFIKYNWQISYDNGISWETPKFNGTLKNEISFIAQNEHFGCLFRCVIKDYYGNSIITNSAKLLEKNPKELQIISQPENISADVGDKISFHIEAVGSGIKYNWQHSGNGGSTWHDTPHNGHDTNTISFDVKSFSYNMLYRCIITDCFGNFISSDICRVMKNEVYIPLQILSQPEDVEGDIGDTVSFTVNATGTDLTYTWQHSADKEKTWANSGFLGKNTNTVTFTIKDFSYNMRYRCVIKDRLGNSVITNVVKPIPHSTKGLSITTTDYDNSFNDGNYTTLVNAYDFLNNSSLFSINGNQNAAAQYNCSINTDNNDLLILKLTAQAKDKCAKININIDNGVITATYPVYTQKADYYIPITNITGIKSIMISLTTEYQNIFITDFQLVNFEGTDITKLKTGIYLKNCNELVKKESEAFGSATTASIADDKYLYSVCKGTLTIYDISNGNTPKIISTLNKLGNCHDISLINNGKALIITSRENGAYFVDINNINNPVVASQYATLELGTGLAVCGNYAFICSRYFGVEIVDASDIYNPVYYSQITNSEELYDCCVQGNYVFISAWAQKKVHIYDISNLRKPKLVNTILLDGNAGGIVAENGFLYIATGYHSRDNSSLLSSVGFGMGNGLEIYDITNPEHPTWISTSKIDGRYKYSGFDYWKVKISGSYAILASTYNGAYIYDISNPSSPLRINHTSIRIEKSSPNYKKFISGNYIFNFDTSSYSQAPLLSVCTSKDRLFFGDPITGIYQMNINGLDKEKIPNGLLSGSDKEIINIQKIDGYTASIYESDASVYAAEAANDLIYLATSNGIKVLSEDLTLLYEYKTDNPVKDLVISKDGKYLYTAESDNGVGIYSINGKIITRLSICKNSSMYNFTVSSLALSADESFLILQAGFSRISTVDISDKLNPEMSSTTSNGSLYYRNICQGLIAEKYNAIIDSGKLSLYCEKDNGFIQEKTLTNKMYSETNGLAAYNNYIISIYNNGYIYFDPLTWDGNISQLSVKKINNIKLKGKPSIYGNIMVVSYCYGKEVNIVDISDLDNPSLIAQIKIDATVDVASITDEFILIPLRNNGLLKLSREFSGK